MSAASAINRLETCSTFFVIMNEGAFGQTGLLWVVADVVSEVFELVLSADNVIKVLVKPEGATLTCPFVDLSLVKRFQEWSSSERLCGSIGQVSTCT